MCEYLGTFGRYFLESKFLTYAEVHNYIDHNPLRSITAPKVKRAKIDVDKFSELADTLLNRDHRVLSIQVVAVPFGTFRRASYSLPNARHPYSGFVSTQ
jgi:hypothetical protein